MYVCKISSRKHIFCQHLKDNKYYFATIKLINISQLNGYMNDTVNNWILKGLWCKYAVVFCRHTLYEETIEIMFNFINKQK